MSLDPTHAETYLKLYEVALPEVYGYVRRRVNSDQAAEDVTAETFVSALRSLRSTPEVEATMTTPWLIGVARHKIVDHWRAAERHTRRVDAAADAMAVSTADRHGGREFTAVLDARVADQTLARLSSTHRLILTLRYMDDLPVREVAAHIGRGIPATEALLTRAKAAFRSAYQQAVPEGGAPGV